MLVEKKGRLAVWVGSIPKKAQFNAYLKETYADDDESPISAFCADMQDTFYDHDFVFGEWYGAKDKPLADLLSDWNQAHTWDTETGRALTSPEYAFQGSLADVYTLLFSADGNRCVAATMTQTCVWETPTTGGRINKPLQQFAAKAIVPDGKIAFGCELKKITARSLADGKPVSAIDRAIDGSDFALLPDGQMVTTNYETKEVVVWNAKTGKRLSAIAAPLATRAIAASPSGAWAVTYDGKQAVIANLAERKASQPIQFDADIRDVQVPTDDFWVALPRTGPLQVRSLRTGKLTQTLGAAKDSYWKMYAAGTTVAAIATSRVYVEAWNAKSGKSLGRYPDRAKPKPDELVDAAAVSPDGKTIAVGLRSGAIHFLQSTAGKLAAKGK